MVDFTIHWDFMEFQLDLLKDQKANANEIIGAGQPHDVELYHLHYVHYRPHELAHWIMNLLISYHH